MLRTACKPITYGSVALIAMFGAAWPTVAGCQPTRSPTVDTQAVGALRARLQAGENSGQADSMPVLVANDAIILPPNASTITGKAAFADWVRGAMQSMTFHVDYQSQEVVASGDWAFDRGTYTRVITPKAGGAAVTERGKYLWLLHREANGLWRYARSIWNSDAATTAAR